MCLLPLWVFGCRWVWRTAPLGQGGAGGHFLWVAMETPHLAILPSMASLATGGFSPPQIQSSLAPERGQINTARRCLGCCPISSAQGANTTIFPSATTCLPQPPHHHLLISSRCFRPGPGLHSQPEESWETWGRTYRYCTALRYVQKEYNGFVHSQQLY